MRNLQSPGGSIRYRTKLLPLAVALLIALPCGAQSLRVDYEVGVGASHSDNIGLSSTDKQGETVVSPMVSFEANKDASDLQLKARGNFQYADYLNNRFDDDFLGDFAGQANWHLIPERLALVVADYLGRTPVDMLGGLTPGNQQEVNVLTVGPTLYLRPGQSTQAQVDLRLTDARSSENKEFDSRRAMIGTSVFHALTATQSVSFNVEAGNVRFKNNNDSDYDRYNAFAGYRRQSAKGYLELSGGYTRLRFKQARTITEPLPGVPGAVVGPRPRTQSGPMVRLDSNLQLSPQTRLSLHGRYELTDAANDMVVRNSRFDEPVLPDLMSPNLLIGPNVYKQRRFQVGYEFNNERFSAYVSPYTEHVEYQDGTNFGWNARGVYASAEYRLTPRLDLKTSGSFEKRNTDRGRDNRDTLLRVQLFYAFSRHVSGWVGAQQRHRDSQSTGPDYRENMAMAGFSYRR